MSNTEPGLLGLANSNRDFRLSQNWGKNIFNNAFPTALACYMSQREIHPVYLMLDETGAVVQSFISVDKLFGIHPFSPSVFYAFETDFTPYQSLVLIICPGQTW